MTGIDEDGISIGSRYRSGPTIDVFAVPEDKTVKNRLHFDCESRWGSACPKNCGVPDLGARRVDAGQAADVSWVVVADPEGNEFCLLARSVPKLCSRRCPAPRSRSGDGSAGWRPGAALWGVPHPERRYGAASSITAWAMASRAAQRFGIVSQ